MTRPGLNPVSSRLVVTPDRDVLLLYLGLTLLSLNGALSKLIPLDAFTITQLRSVIAIGGFYCVYRLLKFPLAVSSFPRLAGVYGLGVLMGVHWGTFFHAMQIATVAVGILALFSYPMITILLEPLFTRKPLAGRDLLSGLLVFAGLLIMVWPDLRSGGSGQVLAGACWGVFSALLFAVRNLLQKYCFSQVPSGTLMFHQLIAIALLFIPFVRVERVQQMAPSGWWWLVVLGLFGTAAAHTLYALSLKTLAAKSVSLIGCMQPVVSILLAWLAIHEVPSVTVVVGGSIILGVAVVESGFRRSP